MVLVTHGHTHGDQFPFSRQAVSIEGMVVEKGSSFLHIAVARWPEGVWQTRRDAPGSRFSVDKWHACILFLTIGACMYMHVSSSSPAMRGSVWTNDMRVSSSYACILLLTRDAAGARFRVDKFWSALPFQRMNSAVRALRTTKSGVEEDSFMSRSLQEVLYCAPFATKTNSILPNPAVNFYLSSSSPTAARRSRATSIWRSSPVELSETGGLEGPGEGPGEWGGEKEGGGEKAGALAESLVGVEDGEGGGEGGVGVTLYAPILEKRKGLRAAAAAAAAAFEMGESLSHELAQEESVHDESSDDEAVAQQEGWGRGGGGVTAGARHGLRRRWRLWKGRWWAECV